ncbi:tetratricopeptide repeat protein [Phenylobacterium sp.]|uniref:tetratricopeptide repeat protein n=1 Tax=Phenylobacterium sp. TaxID=1871053 RepID=UPI0027305744|nr:tetratricopeptide repeat protein [Phenylobacterium sp.]MDP1874998.1 tetratricopeptide repeat protein [Phenylobacterium sp.]MDP3489475.1 tetratricopeptide repeat protein [Phenylobacterium sp.]
MLGRIIGLLLGLGLGGLAYAVLNPGGLEGQIPSIDLGAFEGVRRGVALAAGLLGAALVVAALMRSPARRKARDGLPVIADFKFADDVQDAKEAALPEEPRPFPGLSPLQALEASPVPEPAPFPAATVADALDSAPEPELETEVIEPAPPATGALPSAEEESEPAAELPAPLAAVAAASLTPPSEAGIEPGIEPASEAASPSTILDEGAPDSPPPAGHDFDAARAELRTHARAEAWAPAAQALQRVSALAATDRQQMLAAQDAGDFARAQGRTDDAIESYDLALAYARQAEAPELIADALLNVGDMAYEEHRLDAAVESYETALILRRQIAQEVGDADARRALSIALERLADAREDRGHRTRALDLYRESEAIAADLAETDAGRYGADLAATRLRLEELEARIMA